MMAPSSLSAATSAVPTSPLLARLAKESTTPRPGLAAGQLVDGVIDDDLDLLFGQRHQQEHAVVLGQASEPPVEEQKMGEPPGLGRPHRPRCQTGGKQGEVGAQVKDGESDALGREGFPYRGPGIEPGDGHPREQCRRDAEHEADAVVAIDPPSDDGDEFGAGPLLRFADRGDHGIAFHLGELSHPHHQWPEAPPPPKLPPPPEKPPPKPPPPNPPRPIAPRPIPPMYIGPPM